MILCSRICAVTHGSSQYSCHRHQKLLRCNTQEGAAPASTDKRLAIELAIVKAKAVSGETDLKWIDARYQIAHCLTKHASRKSEAVLQKILQETQWRIPEEEDMLNRRKREREIRNSSSCDEESWLTSEIGRW